MPLKTPYPEQDYDSRILASMQQVRAANFSLTGQGKTGVSILTMNRRGLTTWALVVCPSSVMYKWAREVGEWWEGDGFYPATWVADGPLKGRLTVMQEAIDYHRPSVVVTNFETLRQHGEWLIKHPPQWLIIDEAHKIRQSPLARRQASKILGVVEKIKSEHLLLLTATPVDKDKVYQYWSYFRLLDPKSKKWHEMLQRYAPDYAKRFQTVWSGKKEDVWRSFDRFKNFFGLTEDVYMASAGQETEVWNGVRPGPVVDAHGNTYRDQRNQLITYHSLLQEYIKAIAIRRTDKSYLPALTTEVVEVGWYPKQQSEYKKMAKFLMARRADDSLLVASNAAVQVLRLRQFAIEYGGQSHKFDYVMNEIETATRPILVYCSFKAPLHALAERLLKAGIVYNFLTGDTSLEIRRWISEQVNKGQLPVVLCTYGEAGGVGVDLYGADRIIALNQPHESLHWEQAVGRIHRTGQQNPCLVTILETRGSVESDVRQALERGETVTSRLLVEMIWKRGVLA
jgi:SNF2 family DNA or RNA helicase